MSTPIDLATIAALLGDPARANILCALQDGRAQTATELAYVAGVSPQTTSGHLAKLTEARLLTLQKQGRHRYYGLASPLVGRMLEAVMAVAAVGPPRHRSPSKLDDALRRARTCYDHLAGRLGVALADALVAQSCIVLGEDGGQVTRKGRKVPPLSRLERETPASCRRAWRRVDFALLRARLDRPAARQPRGQYYQNRTKRLRRDLRPHAAASVTAARLVFHR